LSEDEELLDEEELPSFFFVRSPELSEEEDALDASELSSEEEDELDEAEEEDALDASELSSEEEDELSL
jgi:hypothetical protein